MRNNACVFIFVATFHSMQIETRIQQAIRNVPDFPKPGIQFKDITPIFLDPQLCNDIADATIHRLHEKPDAICAIESRGFFLGMLLSHKLNVPLFPVRKAGKLPSQKRAFTYDLEYGSATLEIHRGVIRPGWKVLVNDDLLATGGTAVAAAELVKAEGGTVVGFSFIVELSFLDGLSKLKPYNADILRLVTY